MKKRAAVSPFFCKTPVGITVMDNDRKKRRKEEGAAPSRVEDVDGYTEIQLIRQFAEFAGIPDLFFRCHDGLAKDVTRIDGREYLSFSSYDYLGFNGTEAVNQAAAEAMRLYGTTAGANRLSSGERPPHRRLERELADFLGLEDCLSFVSGYTTNVSVLTYLFGNGDLIAHDAKSHNSLILGASFSGAARFAYPHNDLAALNRFLASNRGKYHRAIIVSEGLFSMDGSIAKLPELVETKKRHDCFLMLDEAHSIGVLGAAGRGAAEYFGLEPAVLDITMGTLSKTFCGCGGFIAGSAGLIDYLKYSAPGFLYSVGMPPPIAAASHMALVMLRQAPERLARLREAGQYFLEGAKQRGLDTGVSAGVSIIPVIIGSSLAASYLSLLLFEHGVIVHPVLYPVVEETSARLRFFLTAGHRAEQLDRALDLTAELLPEAMTRAETAQAGISFLQA